MGSNKRYAEHYDKLMRRRITEMAIKPTPISLTDAELDVDADPIVRAPRPVPARGWCDTTRPRSASRAA